VVERAVRPKYEASLKRLYKFFVDIYAYRYEGKCVIIMPYKTVERYRLRRAFTLLVDCREKALKGRKKKRRRGKLNAPALVASEK